MFLQNNDVMSEGSSLNVQIHKQEMLCEDDRLLVPTSPQKTSSCSELFARLSPTRRGRGQLVLLALVWKHRAQGATQMPGWVGAGGGGHRGSVVCMQPRVPPHRHASCRQQTGPAPGERWGAGEVQDTQSRGHLQLLKRGKPLEGLPVNRLDLILVQIAATRNTGSARARLQQETRG